MTFYNRNGILYVRINGKRVSTKLKDTKANRKLFESYAKNDEFFYKFDIKKKVPTVLELCEKVLLEKESILKGTSFYSYSSLYKTRIIPFFKNKFIDEIKPKDIYNWHKTIKDVQTIITCTAILRPAFEKAILEEYIKSSPMIISKPKRISSYEIKPFNLKEINLIIDNSPERLKHMLGVAFYTGMRSGEVFGLKWSDIDFNEYSINIQRTVTNGFIQSPKTKSSLRKIDMIKQAEYHLKKQKKIHMNSEYVFLNTKGTCIKSTSSLHNMWNNLLKKCSLEHRGIYQTRHSFASNMLSNGEDILWVSHMLGHKNPSITLTKYSKYIKKNVERKNTFLDCIDTESAHIF